MSTLVQLALRRTLGQIRHVDRVRPGRGGATVVGVHRQVEADFGLLAPPIALHTAAPPALAASWAMLREALVADGRVPRAVKEAVASGVSERNRCPYCVEVHSATLDALTGPVPGSVSVVDPVVDWARTGRGASAPFDCLRAPEHIGTSVVFHYLNRMVAVFLGDSPLPPAVPDSARATARRVLGRMMRPNAVASHRPGRSLEFLPPADLAPDLAWATPNPVLADAFSRAYGAIERLAEHTVPDEVRAAVGASVAGWDGGPVGLSRAWAYDETEGVSADNRPAAVLALLTAKAAYQVDDAIVADVRRGGTDTELIALTSWAALTAARALGPGSAPVPHASTDECGCPAPQPL
jgi:alkylhydroperoxidase family enzyme